MSFFRYIFNWFFDLFRDVGSTQIPSSPEVVALPPPEEELEEASEAPEELEFEFVPTNLNRLTKSYTSGDFTCADSTTVPGKYYNNMKKLAENLERLSVELGKPVVIVDGFRTEEYNRHIGGNKNSTHLVCLGAEIKVKGMSRERLAAKIKELIKEGKLEKGGVAVYPNGVHFDVRGKNLSWVGKRKLK